MIQVAILVPDLLICHIKVQRMIKHIKCALYRHVSRHNLIWWLYLSLNNGFYSSVQSILLEKYRRQMGTHTLQTHQPTDHKDLISCCHKTFIPHLSLRTLLNERSLSAAKWQSGLLTVFSIPSNGEQWHRP